MQEKWTRWEPTGNLSTKYYVQSISDTFSAGFKIKLIDYHHPEKKVLIAWPGSVYAYRQTYESFTLLTLNDLIEQYGKNFTDWTFFKIENSEYLKWISKQSYEITDSLNFTHFCIYSTEEMVDILSSIEPEVSIISHERENLE
jgi:hypothetical protein